MKISISQPTFFPWIGYFDIIDQVNIFVILDDVNFDYQSWQHRNNFITAEGLKKFSIQVVSGKKRGIIKNIKIKDNIFFQKKFEKFIYFNYKNSKYFENYFEELKKVIKKSLKNSSLLELNFNLICWINKILGVKTNIKKSSELNLNSKKVEKIIDICNSFDAREYLTTIGAKEYLYQKEYLFKNHNIKLIYHEYNHPKYNQNSEKFIKYASIIDLIFNEGKNSLEIIKSGRKFT